MNQTRTHPHSSLQAPASSLQLPAFTTTRDKIVAHSTCFGIPGSIFSHGVVKLVFIEI